MESNELDVLYQEIVLDHYRRPRNQTLVASPDLKAEGFNPFCGDQVVLTASLDPDGRIAQVGFNGNGCAISQASASMLTDVLKGRTVDDARALVARFKGVMQGEELTEEEEDALGDLAVLQGVREFPVRVKCALLAWTTLLDGIEDYNKRTDGAD